MIETKEDHLNFLQWMKEENELADYNAGFGMAVPKLEGAFYFGRYVSMSEYAKLYEKECKKRGWL